jgi:hypothetical protein
VITADTITDEQILALRDSVAPYATPKPRAECSADDLAVIDACDRALTPYPEYAEKRAAARIRCAEILNARSAK